MSRYRIRLFLFTALILTGIGALLARLYDYQIKERSRFLSQVLPNYTVAIREPGFRGEIKDRNSITLAKNTRNYEVVFNLDEIRDDYRRHLIETQGKDAIRDFETIKTHEIVNAWVRPKLAKHKLDANYNSNALNTHFITHRGLVPFTFRDDLTYDQFAYFAEHNLEMPGVDVRLTPRRSYPYGSLASHVLGYIRQWEKGKISDEDKNRFEHFTGDSIGVAGVEATMNRYLTGSPATSTVLKNEKGKTIRVVDSRKADIGSTVYLTIDSRIQCLVENTLRRVGRAAAVVLDPNTGEVLAMASVPDFTPSFFVPSIDPAAWDSYRENKANPLVNQAINNFTPGSTFKIPTAVAGAMHGHANDYESCPGYVQYGNVKIRCWKTYGHGTLGLEESIQRSCNPYFMKIANELGSNKMLEAFTLMGFGEKTGIELPEESAGLIPGTKVWRREIRPGASVTPAITGMMAIGQSDCSATPLQLASLIGAIANGGKLYQPRVIKKVIHPRQGIAIADRPKLKTDLTENGISQENLQRIRQGMFLAANKAGGTASRSAIKDRGICAKTGTAQTTDMGIKSNDAWTVAFAPFEEPRYVVVVAVKRGTSGGKVAGPLVNLIMRGLFAQEEGLKLPLTKMREFAGDFIVRDEVELPESDDLLEIAYEDVGETGNEIDEAVRTAPRAILVKPRIARPTIREEADRAGSEPPRAIIIEE